MRLFDYERKHLEMLRKELAGCTVLLKTDGSFPLPKPGPIALYGSGARHTVKGGTGSGEVNSRFFVTAEEGLEAAGFTVTSKGWLNGYDSIRRRAKNAFLKQVRADILRDVSAVAESMGKVMPEPEYDMPLSFYGETAVYVLARNSGEGSDRAFVPGDILLTASEIRDILYLQEHAKRFLLALNVGGPVDLSPVKEQVSNILVLSQLGVETGAVLADVLLGKANPSGKLTTTWAAAADYPSVGDFGGRDDTVYREGIYVGYRYFDSECVQPLFPFGWGLSYTSFAIGEHKTELDGETVTVTAAVKNTGALPGRETLQLYVSKPEEKLDQAFRDLTAFAKTNELAPGEEESLRLCFALSDIASYDSQRECWVLEKGDYFLRLSNGVADPIITARVRLEEEVITRRAKNVCGVPDFSDWRPKLETIDMFPPDVPILTADPAAIPQLPLAQPAEQEIDPLTERMSVDNLISLSLGAYDPKGGIAAVIGDAGISVAGAAGETAAVSRDFGLPTLVMADGPAGLRLCRDYALRDGKPVGLDSRLPGGMNELLPKPIAWVLELLGPSAPLCAEVLHQYCTAIPIGTAVAQSWDLDFARLCGDIVGDEMERFNVDLWLAPALNIHRDIRCGRNFEYYSEDPLLSGLMAAAVTQGVQAHPGRGTTVKHYAANNQEYNRYNSNSHVSERAMREVYLRGFGICVRRSQPAAVMTSYNLLNGVHTSEHSGILNDILRGEFGFQGIVMTDWVISAMSGGENRYPSADAGRVAAAGGELFMPGSSADADSIRAAMQRRALKEDRLRRNVSNLLRTIRKLKQ